MSATLPSTHHGTSRVVEFAQPGHLDRRSGIILAGVAGVGPTPVEDDVTAHGCSGTGHDLASRQKGADSHGRACPGLARSSDFQQPCRRRTRALATLFVKQFISEAWSLAQEDGENHVV